MYLQQPSFLQDCTWQIREAAEDDYVEKACTTQKHRWAVQDKQLVASVGA